MSRTFAVNQIDIGINFANDLYLDSQGNLAISIDSPGNPESVLQNCAHIAKTLLGEMVLSTLEGIPYFETAWAGTPNFPQFEAEMRRALRTVPGVTNVIDFIIEIDTDTSNIVSSKNILRYTAVIETLYGMSTLNG